MPPLEHFLGEVIKRHDVHDYNAPARTVGSTCFGEQSVSLTVKTGRGSLLPFRVANAQVWLSHLHF